MHLLPPLSLWDRAKLGKRQTRPHESCASRASPDGRHPPQVPQGKGAVYFRGACLGVCGVLEIERRPRGASRAEPGPTFVSGQFCLGYHLVRLWVHLPILHIPPTPVSLPPLFCFFEQPRTELARAAAYSLKTGGASAPCPVTLQDRSDARRHRPNHSCRRG